MQEHPDYKYRPRRRKPRQRGAKGRGGNGAATGTAGIGSESSLNGVNTNFGLSLNSSVLDTPDASPQSNHTEGDADGNEKGLPTGTVDQYVNVHVKQENMSGVTVYEQAPPGLLTPERSPSTDSHTVFRFPPPHLRGVHVGDDGRHQGQLGVHTANGSSPVMELLRKFSPNGYSGYPGAMHRFCPRSPTSSPGGDHANTLKMLVSSRQPLRRFSAHSNGMMTDTTMSMPNSPNVTQDANQHGQQAMVPQGHPLDFSSSRRLHQAGTQVKRLAGQSRYPSEQPELLAQISNVEDLNNVDRSEFDQYLTGPEPLQKSNPVPVSIHMNNPNIPSNCDSSYSVITIVPNSPNLNSCSSTSDPVMRNVTSGHHMDSRYGCLPESRGPYTSLMNASPSAYSASSPTVSYNPQVVVCGSGSPYSYRTHEYNYDDQTLTYGDPQSYENQGSYDSASYDDPICYDDQASSDASFYEENSGSVLISAIAGAQSMY